MKNSIAVIILSVVASLLIWLLTNLAQQNTDIVSVPITVSSNIPGHTLTANEQVIIVAAVSANGYKLISLSARHDPRTVTIDQSHLQHKEGDFYTIESGSLFRYVSDIFGAGVTVQSFITSSLTLRFPEENYKVVPVVPVHVVHYKPQYMSMGQMRVKPDSVIVYGEPSRIEAINQVYTKPVSLRGVRRSVSGVVSLDVPGATRLSDQDVTYSMDVTRFVEVRSLADVSTINVPAGHSLTVLPSRVEVYCRYVFPLGSATVEEPKLYVDYKEFALSKTGKCVIHVGQMPSGAISAVTSPLVCDCIESVL